MQQHYILKIGVIFIILAQPLLAQNDIIEHHRQADSAQIAAYRDLNIPLLIIETEDHTFPTADVVWNSSHTAVTLTNHTKVPGRLIMLLKEDTIYDSKEYLKDESGITLKLRGNSSAADQDKPGYKIKLQKKADLLLREDGKNFKDKEWALIKENVLKFKEGFYINELIGMPWTPQYRYVNVILNNYVLGHYMLIETVKQGSHRVNISKEGYCIEYDAYFWNEDITVPSIFGYAYSFKYPDSEDLLPWQLDYVTQSINQTEIAYSQPNSCAQYIDVNNFAKWLLGHDILGNGDGSGSNIYLNKYDTTSTAKWFCGPLWDFDGIEQTPNQFSSDHSIIWFNTMFNLPQDTFIHAYIQEWERIEPVIFDSAIARINRYATSEEAEDLNKSRLLNQYNNYGNPWPDTVSVQQDAARITKWLANRHVWLKDTISQIAAKYSSEQMPTTIYNPTYENSPKAYYSILGFPVHHPLQGVTIVCEDNKIKKVVTTK